MTAQTTAKTLAVLMVCAALTAAGRCQDASIIEIENIVQAAVGGKGEWTAAVPKQSLAVGDRIRTRNQLRHERVPALRLGDEAHPVDPLHLAFHYIGVLTWQAAIHQTVIA